MREKLRIPDSKVHPLTGLVVRYLDSSAGFYRAYCNYRPEMPFVVEGQSGFKMAP